MDPPLPPRRSRTIMISDGANRSVCSMGDAHVTALRGQRDLLRTNKRIKIYIYLKNVEETREAFIEDDRRQLFSVISVHRQYFNGHR